MKFLTTLAVLPLALAACSKNDSTGNVDAPAAAPVAAAAAPAGQNWTETVVKTPEGYLMGIAAYRPTGDNDLIAICWRTRSDCSHGERVGRAGPCDDRDVPIDHRLEARRSNRHGIRTDRQCRDAKTAIGRNLRRTREALRVRHDRDGTARNASTFRRYHHAHHGAVREVLRRCRSCYDRAACKTGPHERQGL